MAGLASSLDIAEAMRRLGVKGAAQSLPIVPGIFPTLSIWDLSDLVSRPKRAIGFSPASIMIVVGTRAVFKFGGSRDMIVTNLNMNGTTNIVWSIDVIVGSVLAPGPAINMGELQTVNGMEVQNPGPAAGRNMAYGSAFFPNLQWFIPGGSYLSLVAGPAPGLINTFASANCSFTEIPTPAVEP